VTTLGSEQPHDDADLLAALASGGDLKTFLADLVQLAAKHTPSAAACGLTMARSSGPVTVAATGPLAERADERQYELDAGPCLEAMRDGVVVRVEDMTREDRWGAYPALAADAGVRSSLSLPLVVEGRSRGALNLYATEAGAFGPDDETTGANWAGHASGALGVALRISDSDERADALQGGLDSRTTIGQAVGLLMARERCTADQAFALLRLSSQRRNVKLRDIAAGVVSAFEAALPEGPDRW
jgi:putative methionine-R-sulfoxide reductase with GAF domain